MQKNQNDEHSLNDFLKALFQYCKPDAYLNLRFLPSAENLFVPLGKMNTIPFIINSHRNQNCYFGVATRRDGDGSKEGIAEIPSLWCDVDVIKGSPAYDHFKQVYKDFSLKPSILVESGGGYHLYWLLKEPSSKNDIPRVEDLLKRISFHLGGDKVAAEAARILRVPGTYNLKYTPKKRITIGHFHAEKQYNLDDFEILPPLPGGEVTGGFHPSGWEKDLLKGVSDGERNTSIARLAGRYIGKGLSKEEILPILMDANSRFAPPLGKKEIEVILDSMTKTDSRNHPDRSEEVSSEPIPQHTGADWPTISKQAFHGIAGEFVRLVEPHTEADPVALLIQFLSATGNIIGVSAHFRVEADRHRLKINPILVGETSKGRKGTSLGYIKSIYQSVDSEWALGRLSFGGLSSGEGLVWEVRDEIWKKECVREKGRVTQEFQQVLIDQGVSDKRLLVIEQEFSSTLRVMSRDGNTLSPTIRQSWDDSNLRILTKNNPARSTGCHISIIGHITKDELRRYLDRTEMGNGFANRFLWVCVRRSKTLPEGSCLGEDGFKSILGRLMAAIEFARSMEEIKKNDRARGLWAEVYPDLSAGKPGLIGAVISRGEAQVMRLACLYAVLDQSKVITTDHLLAALALWDYCEASARYIWGDAIGDPVADRILGALRNADGGLSRTEIRDLFFRHTSSSRIDLALTSMESANLIQRTREDTGGRPVERWQLYSDKSDQSDKRV
jgi:hypothetical protein